MDADIKRKSFRLNPELINAIHTFMASTKIPDLKEISGKYTIHQSIKKAIWYLFHAFFDNRGFNDRGLFDRSLFELRDRVELFREKGFHLNELNKSYSSGKPPAHDPFTLLDDIQSLLEENRVSLDNFNTSYKL